MESSETGWNSTITTSALHPPRLRRLATISESFLNEGRWSNNGPLVQQAEVELASWHDAKYCVVVSSGFWALVLAAKSLKEVHGVSGSEVALPSLTYRRLADAMNWAGFTPRFVDVHPDTLSIDLSSLDSAEAARLGLVCAVNPMAGTLNPDELSAWCSQRGVPLLLDSVEAQADSYGNGIRVGSAGQAEVFSCHASKFLNGGEGGYITSNNADLIEYIREVRAFGFDGPERISRAGVNAKMSELQAAWILGSLEGVDPQKHYYESIFRLYCYYLEDVPELRLRNTALHTSFKNIVVELSPAVNCTSTQVVGFLNDHGAQAREYYAPPLHTVPRDYEVRTNDLPNTEALVSRLFLLPSGSRLSADHVARIARLLRRFFDVHGAQ